MMNEWRKKLQDEMILKALDKDFGGRAKGEKILDAIRNESIKIAKRLVDEGYIYISSSDPEQATWSLTSKGRAYSIGLSWDLPKALKTIQEPDER